MYNYKKICEICQLKNHIFVIVYKTDAFTSQFVYIMSISRQSEAGIKKEPSAIKLRKTRFYTVVRLFCAENSVAGIAETGNDVLVFVKALVASRTEDFNIRMSERKSLNSLGSRNNAHKLD